MTQLRISRDERDTHLRAVIKSNLVCGDLSKLDEMIDNLHKDIVDVLSIYDTVDNLGAFDVD